MLSDKYSSVSKTFLLICLIPLFTNILSAQQDSVTVFLKGKSEPVKFYAARVFKNGLFNNKGEGLLFWVIDSLVTSDSSLAFNLQKTINGLKLRKNNSLYKLDFTAVIYPEREEKKKGIDSLEQHRREAAIQSEIADSINKSRQDLADLYKEYIPESLYNNPESKKQVNIFLESASKINPELIYFQLMRFNAYDSSRTEFLEYSNYVKKVQEEYKIKRKEWASEIIDKLNNPKYEKAYSSEAIEILNDFLNYSSSEQKTELFSFHVDSTLMNQFIVMYYLKENLIIDSSFKSVEKRFILEEKKRRDLINLAAISTEQIKTELVEELLSSWYLFPGKEINEDSLKECFAELLVKAIGQKYRSKKEFTFSVGIFDYIKPPDFFIVGPEPVRQLGIKIPYESFTYSIAFSYKYYIKHSISAFSYLNFRLSYSSIESVKYLSFKDKTFYLGNSLYESYNFRANGIQSYNSLSTYISQISFPILVYRDFFTIEPSFCFGKSFFSYEVAYSYTYSKYERISINQEKYYEYIDGAKKEKNTYTDTIMGLGIELKLKTFRNFSTSISIIMNHYQILLNYSLPLEK